MGYIKHLIAATAFAAALIPSGAFAQIKELFPVSVAGMSTASINLFSFSGGAILVTLAGFIITEKTVAEYTTLWTAVVIMMAIATVISFLTVEKRSE